MRKGIISVNKTPDFRDSIVKRFVRDVPLMTYSCDSFDDFVNRRISQVINRINTINCTSQNFDKAICISMQGGRLDDPCIVEKDGQVARILPMNCRIRGCSYSAPLYVDLIIEWVNGSKTTMKRFVTPEERKRKREQKEEKVVKKCTVKDVFIGYIPIMVFSSKCYLSDPKKRIEYGECDHDPGGYFIINGNEKSLVGQKSSIKNRMIAYGKKGLACAVAIKSKKNDKVFTTTISLKPQQILMCTFPRLEEPVPLLDVLILLGMDMESLRHLFDTNEMIMLNASFKEASESIEKAREKVQIREVYGPNKTPEQRLRDALFHVLLPHLPYEKKSFVIVHMIKKLLSVARGDSDATDRDSVINQRVEVSCTLLSTLFFNLMIKLQSDMRLEIQKRMSKYKTGITSEKIKELYSGCNVITDGIRNALSTGNWNTSSVNRLIRKGVSQALQRLSRVATLSQLRRISSSVDSSQNLTTPRHLQGTMWGRYCAFETPEGKTCGLETQLSLGAYVSIHTQANIIRDVVTQYINGEPTFQTFNIGTRVFINGVYEGNTLQCSKLITTVRNCRRSRQFSKDISVSFKEEEKTIHISTTSGRVCRPLLIVLDGKHVYNHDQHSHLSFHQLLSLGIIEYLDCEEEDECLVAFEPSELTNEHTHCEISCTLSIYGLVASTIPFSDHNPATRNCYQSAMAKQSQGVNKTNFLLDFPTTLNVLDYGQKPLCSTKLANYYQIHATPQGVNVILGIGPWQGFNQEDSFVVNQAAVDRGLFRSTIYKTVKETTSSNKDVIRTGKPTKQRRVGKYSNTDVDGLLFEGTNIKLRDCIFGIQKVSKDDYQKSKKGQRITWQDDSKLAKIEGTVDKMILAEQPNGERKMLCRIRKVSGLTIGDKVCSRHGQKGVCGMVVPGVDLPRNIDGITPDIMINPHAIPSRMTVAHLFEMLGGKAAAMSGTECDASPFTGLTIHEIAEQMHSWGFQKYGCEQMYSGISGEMIEAKMFMGPIFYQRLRHMVSEKMHARSRGPMNQLTGQPNEGRRNNGGLRVGNMEKDAMNAHGVPYVINERMFISSDKHEIKVCPKCQTHLTIHQNKCSVCSEDAKKVGIPYAAHLLCQELQSMGINLKLKIKEKQKV